MREIGAFEAKNKLGTLLGWVEGREEVMITRRGKAVARMVPATSGLDHAKAVQAATNIRLRSVGITLNGPKIKDLINEGRS